MNEQPIFTEVTEEFLSKTEKKHYGGGSELKVGDTIVWGFNINYANLYGKPPQEIRKDDPISLTLNSFVCKDGLIHELYKQV
jgi:hypothetical protein